jgi:hypothetical protein
MKDKATLLFIFLSNILDLATKIGTIAGDEIGRSLD